MAITDMGARRTAIDGLLEITPKAAGDERGTVREVFRQSAFSGAGAPLFGPPLQVNLTESSRGAIRGLHGEEMSKLVGVAAGSGFGAYVDMRPGTVSFGVVVTVELRPGKQVLVPRGVCNGFQAIGAAGCSYLYCFDSEWAPDIGRTAVHPLDPDLAIDWPIRVDPSDRSLLSAKDAALPSFAEVCRAHGWSKGPAVSGRDDPAGLVK